MTIFAISYVIRIDVSMITVALFVIIIIVIILNSRTIRDWKTRRKGFTHYLLLDTSFLPLSSFRLVTPTESITHEIRLGEFHCTSHNFLCFFSLFHELMMATLQPRHSQWMGRGCRARVRHERWMINDDSRGGWARKSRRKFSSWQSFRVPNVNDCVHGNASDFSILYVFFLPPPHDNFSSSLLFDNSIFCSLPISSSSSLFSLEWFSSHHPASGMDNPVSQSQWGAFCWFLGWRFRSSKWFDLSLYSTFSTTQENWIIAPFALAA